MHSEGGHLREGLIGVAIEGSGGIRYHLRELLGEGGQGYVYKANYDDPDGFWIVVKVLRPDSIATESLKRFQREAEVLRMLGSVPAPNPNIVRFYDYGVHTTTSDEGEMQVPFIALEYVEGQTLGKVISAHGGFGLPVGRVRRIMKQVARALHTVHERRIVHRDLKPSNILLTQLQGQEVAKVTDFGIVKLPELSANRTATVAGASLGYAPPEQYEMGNNRVSVQTDVFSFAAILFEALSGTEAFPCKAGDNPLRVVARMLSNERPSLARVSATVGRELRDRPELTAELDREIARAISADPSVRHASIRELWERVEPLLVDAGARSMPSINVADEPSFEGGSTPPTPPSAMPDVRVVGKPMTGERLRAGTLSSDGKSLVAVGAHGLYLFSRGVWSALHLPPGVDARFIRGVLRLPTGELCLFGDSGLAVMLAPGGGVDQIDTGDRDLALLGAFADAGGLVFVGERLSRPVGAIVQVSRGQPPRVRTLEGTTRLHGAARLGSGALLLCGSHGDLVELLPEGHREIAWGRTGHLYAIAATPDGSAAFAVGSGGHALRVSQEPALPGVAEVPPPLAVLEVVQTTRDLVSVAVDGSGAAWAGGGQARLLQRRGSVWTRVPLDGLSQAQLVAVAPRGDTITVLAEDGLVIEGRNIA